MFTATLFEESNMRKALTDAGNLSIKVLHGCYEAIPLAWLETSQKEAHAKESVAVLVRVYKNNGAFAYSCILTLEPYRGVRSAIYPPPPPVKIMVVSSL